MSEISNPVNPYIYLILVVLVTLTGMLLMLTSIRVIPAGHVGVLFRLGKLQKELQPGTRWVMPLLDQVMLVNLGEQTIPLPDTLTLTSGDKTYKVEGTFTCKIIEPIPAVIAANQAQKDLAETVGEYLLPDLNQIGVPALLDRPEQMQKQAIQSLNDRMSRAWQVKFTKLELNLILT